MSFSTHRGFTLIETLIAMAISAVLLAGIYNFFISQQEVQNVRGQVAEMQQNVRIAMAIMTREMRMTGYGAPQTNLAAWIPWVAGLATNPKITPWSGTTPATITVIGFFDTPIASLTAAAAAGATSLSIQYTDPGVVAGNTSGADNTVTIGSQSYALGSNTNPKITYLDATMTGSAAVDFRGTITGSGILVIDGNDLIFRGNLNWNGLVIVNGPDVGFGLMGGGASKNINGALVVNERDTDRTLNEFLVNGNGKIHYSREALDLAQTALNNKPLRRVSWRQLN